MSRIEDTFYIGRRQLINELIENDIETKKDYLRDMLRDMYDKFSEDDLIDYARIDGLLDGLAYGFERVSVRD